MLTSSSPTLSAPPSPSSAFHSHPHAHAHAHAHSHGPSHSHRPSYHAARRTSASHSPRFAVSSQPARTPKAVPLFASSPQGTKRAHSYADAGTQYSPAGFPPTYHPPPQAAADQSAPPDLSASAIVDIQQAEGAAAVATATSEPPAPPEPALRVEPTPANAQDQQQQQNDQPSSRPTPREAPHEAEQQQQPPPPQPQRIVPADAAREEVPASPAKRPRPQEASVKVMPLKYETCDVKDLGVLISDMLMELVRLNDGYPLRDGQLTRFHSR